MNPDILQAIKHQGQTGAKSLKKTPRMELSERHKISSSAKHDKNKAVKHDIHPRKCDLTEWDMLVQRVRRRTVIPFVGAGLSCGFFPMWERLIEELMEKLGLPQMKGEKMPVKTEVIRDALRKRERESSGKRDVESQSLLAVEFVELFRKALEDKGCVDWFEPLVEAERPPSWSCTEVIRTATRGHRAVTTGPWPLILTTNWDTMLEAAYRMMDINHGRKHAVYTYDNTISTLHVCVNAFAGDVWDWSRPHTSYFTRFEQELCVRFRRNIQQVYAELRSDVRPTRLLKLHGDFTENGKKEVIAGHADYRQLMVRDVAFNRFMQHISSHYNLLFYGCSLTDPDMLATLDGMVESLGSEVGPHFWLTADEVSDERKRFLAKHYSVYTIRTERAWQFSDALSLLIKLCNIGWPIPKPLSFTAVHYQITSQHGTNVNIRIEHRLPQDVTANAIASNDLFALAISGGVSRTGKATGGGQIIAVIEELKLLKHHETKAFRYNMEEEEWRAKHCASNCWMVCAQDVGTSGSLRGVFEAVQHFVKNTVLYLVPGSSFIDKQQLKNEETEVSEAVVNDEQPTSKPDEQSASMAVESDAAQGTQNVSENLNPTAEEPVTEEHGRHTQSQTVETQEVKPTASVDSGLGETTSSSLQSPNSDQLADEDAGFVSRWFNAVYSLVVPEDSDSELSEAERSHSDDGEEEEEEAKSNSSDSEEDSRDVSTSGEGEKLPDAGIDKTDETVKEETKEEPPQEEPKPTLLKLATDHSSDTEKHSRDSLESEGDDDDDDYDDNDAVHGDGPGVARLRKCIKLILPLLSAGGGFLHGQEVLCATLSAIGHCVSLVCGPDVIDIIICTATHPGADNERLALMADIDVGRLCLGQLLTRALHGTMEFTCVTPKEGSDYGSSHTDEKVTKWTCRKVHMPIYATVNELRRELGLPDKLGEEGSRSLLSANIVDGSVIEISE
ncbi:uncharacterized protein LOC134184929 [Corticium candelabrum]|uniref:uncharacterized protein LOC134184929 n=1 Tax=Corticium candelabrum TaxID=121492 RepID=UPI002E315E8E|nr:uncharacterized protein LOC134184929 [Corticium candelabrum]